jgi:hypothetical protein
MATWKVVVTPFVTSDMVTYIKMMKRQCCRPQQGSIICRWNASKLFLSSVAVIIVVCWGCLNFISDGGKIYPTLVLAYGPDTHETTVRLCLVLCAICKGLLFLFFIDAADDDNFS